MIFVQTVIFFALLNFARYLLFAGPAYYFFWVRPNTWTDRHRIQQIPFLREDIKREFFYSVFSSLIFGFILALIFSSFLQGDPMAAPKVSVTEFLIQLLVLIFVHDTYFYWMHRVFHHPLLFAKIHKLHHLSKNPSPWAAFSFHPIEAFFEIAWLIPMSYLFPFDVVVWAAFGFVIVGINVMGHLGVEIYPQSWKKNPVLKYLNFSIAHNQHHFYSRGNYGLYFSFWDRVMGTLRSEKS